MRCSRQNGFTLIEVLVALVIVAVGMSALMGALSSSAKTVVYMQEKSFAEWVALNQITTLRIQLQNGQVPPTGKTNGDIDFAGSSWHWAQEVVASQVPGIVRIDVKVRPKTAGAANDDDNANWFVTVSGIAGNALAAPGSALINWQSWDAAGTGTSGTNAGTTLGGTNNGSATGTTGSGTGTSGTGTGNGTGPTTTQPTNR